MTFFYIQLFNRRQRKIGQNVFKSEFQSTPILELKQGRVPIYWTPHLWLFFWKGCSCSYAVIIKYHRLSYSRSGYLLTRLASHHLESRILLSDWLVLDSFQWRILILSVSVSRYYSLAVHCRAAPQLWCLLISGIRVFAFSIPFIRSMGIRAPWDFEGVWGGGERWSARSRKNLPNARKGECFKCIQIAIKNKNVHYFHV